MIDVNPYLRLETASAPSLRISPVLGRKTSTPFDLGLDLIVRGVEAVDVGLAEDDEEVPSAGVLDEAAQGTYRLRKKRGVLGDENSRDLRA